MVIVPIVRPGGGCEVEGVLQIANCLEEEPFTNEDHFVLQVVAEKIAEFIEGQRAVAMLKGSLTQ